MAREKMQIFVCGGTTCSGKHGEMLIDNLNRNSRKAQNLIRQTVRRLAEEFDSSCRHALRTAIITDPSLVSSEVRQTLQVIIGKYLQ